MSKIEYYTCDLCGAKVNSLADLNEFILDCRAENYHIKATYNICPWCLNVFKDTDAKELFLDRLKFVLNIENLEEK